ncbi:hypothetical protein Tco_1540416 [Tanacetum coccineum]
MCRLIRADLAKEGQEKPADISPEDKLKAYLNSGAGLIVSLETLLTVLELHHHYGTLHRGDLYTMELVLHATEQQLRLLEIPEEDVIQIKTGVAGAVLP